MTSIHQYPPSVTERLYRGQRHAQGTHGYSHTRSRSAFDGSQTSPRQYGITETYTWAAEQEFLRGGSGSCSSPPKRGPMKTEDWVREQRTMHKVSDSLETETVYFTTSTSPTSSRTTSRSRRHEWEELVYVYEVEADQWMRQEEKARKVAYEREKTRLRIQEELRRIEARYQQKREAERLAREEVRRRELAELRERERRDRTRMDAFVADAWAQYESRWASMSSSSSRDRLDFRSTPWPLTVAPRSADDITQDAIATFLFSQTHSQELSRKDRIRSAQLRWHPDRFRRFLARVVEKDRAIVEEGVNVVARVLNELMEKEKKKGY